MDIEIASYVRDGRVVAVRMANSLPRRTEVLNLRTSYYESTLRQLGVATWDGHDERAAAHLLCLEDDRAVASIRVVLNIGERTELHDDFGRPDELIPRPGRPFVTFGRQLVTPDRRGTGMSAVLVHAACLWCGRHSDVEALRVVSLFERAAAVEELGMRRLTGVLPLGPGRTPVVVLGGEVSGVFTVATQRLRAAGWSVAG